MRAELCARKTPAGTAYIELGDGEVLLLVHGVGLNKQVWEPQLLALGEHYRVIAYDSLGHGDSPLPGENAGLDAYFEQIIELLDSLEIPRVNLCGHSMGALITLGFALVWPHRVARILPMMAAYDRSLEHQQRSQRVAQILAAGDAERLLNATLERWFCAEDYRDPARSDKIKCIANWLQQVDKIGYSRAYRLFAEHGETYLGRLDEIAAPALFISAELDPNSTPAMAQRMASEVQQGTVYIMPNERHMGQYLAADSLVELIQRFLQQPLDKKYGDG